MSARRPVAGLVALVLALGPAHLAAHDGLPPEPHDLWMAWNVEPLPLLVSGLAAGLYGSGLTRLWRRAGWGRGLPAWRAATYAAGLVVLTVALVSPVDALGLALFSAHMAQHMLLIAVAAPLLVLGAPLIPLLWATSPAITRRVTGWWRMTRLPRGLWRNLTRPAMALTLHAGLLWLWHLPALYHAALVSEAIHVLEHLCFLLPALLFWWVVLQPVGPRRLNGLAAAFVVFLMMMQSNALGALMTFTPRPWYPAYATTVTAWGLTPLEDQQLAGLIMWAPPSLVYLIAALWLLGSALRAADEDRVPSEKAPSSR